MVAGHRHLPPPVVGHVRGDEVALGGQLVEDGAGGLVVPGSVYTRSETAGDPRLNLIDAIICSSKG